MAFDFSQCVPFVTKGVLNFVSVFTAQYY